MIKHTCLPYFVILWPAPVGICLMCCLQYIELTSYFFYVSNVFLSIMIAYVVFCFLVRFFFPNRLFTSIFQVRNTALDLLLSLIPTTKGAENFILEDSLVGLLCDHTIPSLVEPKSCSLAKQILIRLASVNEVTNHLFNACQCAVKPQLIAAIYEWLAENTFELGLK